MSKELELPKKSATDILAEIALEERAEKIQAARQEKDRYNAALARRMSQDAELTKNKTTRMANCDHLQGNHKPGEMPFRELPHLSKHTFQDNRTRIHCNKCNFNWFPGDTNETIFRADHAGMKQELPNPTGMGWKEVNKMVTRFQSVSNKPSRAFITQPLPVLTEK